jgi:hypothetical protein
VEDPVSPTAADDRFHPPPTPDPSWTETSWFAFMAPERALAGTVYPLFRPNLGISALGVAVWDAAAHEPWRALYARRLWHLPMPDGELDALEVGGLKLHCLEPLSRYQLSYRDGSRIQLDLEYRGLFAPHCPLLLPERGHLDQPCRVRGLLRLGDERIDIDCLDMRDRSWSPRDDTRRTRASYSYGIRDADECFLAGCFEVEGEQRVVSGFLVRAGEKQDLVSGARTVLERREGFPLRVRIEAIDRSGRRLEIEGHRLSRLAEQATPGMFAWMSLTEW